MQRIFSILAIFLLTGCPSIRGKVTQSNQAILPAPVLASQHEREKVQFKAAEAIDVTVAGTSVEVPVKAETAKIVQANQSAPASGVETLVNAYETTIKAQVKEIEELKKQVEAAKNAELKTQAATLRWFGLGAIAIAALLGYARQIQFAAIAGLVGLGSLGLAQLVTQPWFMPAVTAVCGIILVAVGFVIYRSLKDGTLSDKAKAEAAEIKEALSVIVPVLDEAKAKLGEVFTANVLDPLSKRMDYAEKQVIKSIRKETSE
jgi:uncharacterized protein YjeT (DUF2065 family)